jgi:hypothetical protein
METTTDEIAEGITVLDVHPRDGFHVQPVRGRGTSRCCSTAGLGLFLLVTWSACGRSITEADLFGRGRRVGLMNIWLAARPRTVAHTVGCMVPGRHGRSLTAAARAQRAVDLGVSATTTPHVPHGWDAGLYFEETTGTLLCGDLFSATGASPALTTGDIGGRSSPRTCSRLRSRPRPDPRSVRSPPRAAHSP